MNRKLKRRFSQLNKTSGFIMLSIIVTLAIIAIMAFVVMPRYKNALDNPETPNQSIEENVQDQVDSLNEAQEKAEQDMADGLDSILGGE